MKSHIITITALCFTFSVWSQDPQFVQFYAAPLQLNPAMTGVHPGSWRAAVNYRQQWNSFLDNRPFQTMSASLDARNRIGRGDYFAYGLTILHDKAGSANYRRMTGDLSFSYMKQLDGSRYRGYDQYLIGGAQAGFGQHALDVQRLWFSSQFDKATEQVNPTLPSGENIAGNSGIYFNFNAGLLWYAVFDDNASFYAGGAFHHLNAPRLSFIESDGIESIDRKWTLHAGGEIPFNSNLSMLPAAAVIGQGPSLLSMFGTNFRYTNRDWQELALRAGLWGHLAKDVTGGMAVPALTFTAVLELERWNLGFSYDLNINKLSAPTNGRGAFEISLLYYQPAARRERVRCPKM